MGTTVQTVERYLEKDLVVQEALSRGFLNVRRAARWLLDTQGWDTTEEAVVSALRRYRPDSSVDLETALHLLQATTRMASTGLAVLSIPRTRGHMRLIPEVIQLTKPEEPVSLITESNRVLLVLEEQRAPEAEEILRSVGPVRVVRGVAEVQLSFPEEGPAATTASAVVLNVLGHRGVDVLALSGSPSTLSLFIPEPQLSRAYKHALWLTQER